MDNAVVSIIIPIYNVSAFLDNCIQSVCRQTYPDLEIILVDDGSPDDCPQKCDQWAEHDRRIRVIHKKNGGLSDARNAGLDAATGKYIYFLDGDDAIKSDLVESVVPLLECGYDMVVFNHEDVHSDGTVKPRFHELGTYTLSKVNRASFYIDTLLSYAIGWEAWNRVFRRDIIEKHGIRFADNRRIFAEDIYFSLCYCAHIQTIISIPQCLYCYTVRENSIMRENKFVLNAGRMNELAKAVLNYFQKCEDCKDLIAAFPTMHYLIVDNAAYKALHAVKNLSQYREQLRADIADWNFYSANMRLLLRNPAFLYHKDSVSKVAERLSITKYCLDGKYAALRLRNKLIYKCPSLIETFCRYNSEKQTVQEIRSTQKKVFLIGTEEYGNIGDHQINEATIAFLRKCLPEYAVYEITAPEWAKTKQFWMKCIRESDLIVFAGGGNFGDTYPAAHEFRAEVIRRWPKNRKIVFPQTVFYSDSDKGQQTLDRDKKLYTKENNIVLAAREEKSYNIARREFTCRSVLVPDIVLSTDLLPSNDARQGILLCMRQDQERMINSVMRNRLESYCASAKLPVDSTDLQLDYSVPKAYRRLFIDEKFKLFQSCRVVITDRLHGMVFAAITGTPCIVFANFNHKVQGTYKWISYLPYIQYIQSPEELEEKMHALLNLNSSNYDPTPLRSSFEEFEKLVKELCQPSA